MAKIQGIKHIKNGFMYYRPYKTFKNEYFKFTKFKYSNCTHYGFLCFGLSVNVKGD